MPFEIQLLIAFLLPVLALVLLRVNAPMVFLSLCLGDVLVSHVAKDADSFIAFISPRADSLSTTTLQLIMLFIPVVLTTIIMLFSVKGRTKALLNILPAAGASFLALVLAVPLFTPGLRLMIQETPAWHQVARVQALVIGLSALLSLVFLWSGRRHAKKHEGRGRRS